MIKWFFGFLLTLSVLIVLAIIIVPKVFDPNDYRAQIAQLVQEKTGRELQLNGDLSVSVFPWLGIRTQGLNLSQPVEIGGSMLEVDTAQLRLKLVPLLSKRLEIDTVILERPKLSFITLENGVNSLQGLSGEASSTDTTATEGSSPETALVLVIQGLALTDGLLAWHDRQAGQHYQMSDLQLITGNLIGDELADLELSGSLLDLSAAESSVQTSTIIEPIKFALSGQALINTDTLQANARNLSAATNYADMNLTAEIDDIQFDSTRSLLSVSSIIVDLKTQLAEEALAANATIAAFSYDLGRSDLTVNSMSLDLKTKVAEKALSTNSTIDALSYNLTSSQMLVNDVAIEGVFDDQPLRLSLPNVTANISTQTASVGKADLRVADLNASLATLEVTNFIEKPTVSGLLDVPEFDAAALLKTFEIDYATADATALKTVGLSTAFNAGLNQVGLSNIRLSLDDTHLQGDFSARDFSQLAVNFDLALDRLVLDRYMPAAKGGDTNNEGEVGGAEALAVPMALFKDINANGRFKVDKFVSSGIELTDVDVLVESTPGTVSITPRADLYEGELAGSMVYTEQDDVAQLRVQNKIGVVDLAKFLTAADVTEQLSGFGTLELDMLVTERNGVQSNEGTIKLFAKDGAVQGVDIKAMVDQAYATYQQLSGVESVASEQATTEGESELSDATGFAELLGTFDLKDFQLSNNDFQFNAPFFRISGNGDIDLAAQNLNYLLNVAIVKTTSGQGGEALDKLKGVTLPIRLRGSLLAPSYSLDTKAMYNALARQKVNDEKSEYLQEKYGIEGGGELSTKDLIKELIIVETSDKKEPEAPESDVMATQNAEANTAQTVEEPAPLSEEEQREKSKDELEEELKRKLLDSLFN